MNPPMRTSVDGRTLTLDRHKDTIVYMHFYYLLTPLWQGVACFFGTTCNSFPYAAQMTWGLLHKNFMGL